MKLSRYTNLLVSYFLYFNYYLKVRRLVEKMDFSSAQRVREHQFKELQNLISFSYDYVPYYRSLFDRIKFHPKDFKSLEDLKKIPYLTKEIIREKQDELVAVNVKKRHIKKVQTGGTTGMPTEFLLDKRYATLSEMVFLRNMWKRIGYKPYDPCVILREDSVKNIQLGKRYWHRNLMTNWLVMSSYHMNADTFDLFYRRILIFKPKFILAFPSNAMLLANFIKENRLEHIPSVKGVICASENLYDWQRDYMADVYKARVFSYYGHSEKCLLATESSGGDSFEFYPQYGYAELINEQGEYCTNENEKGEIVATGFNNYVSPFIRYKTDDIGTYTLNCKSNHPYWFKIKKIEGRSQDFLIDADGVQKTYMHIDRPFWKLRDKVYAYQYIQNEPGKLELLIHPKRELHHQDIQEINRIFHDTYFKFQLEIKMVENIPRTRSGKFKYLIQNLTYDYRLL